MPDPHHLRELLEKATKGPWVCPFEDDGQISAYADNCSWSADVESSEQRLRPNDSALIVAMHSALPALLDERDALLSRVGELEAALGEALKVIDDLDEYQKQPERGHPWVECACCMGELFNDRECAQIETARQTLERTGHDQG